MENLFEELKKLKLELSNTINNINTNTNNKNNKYKYNKYYYVEYLKCSIKFCLQKLENKIDNKNVERMTELRRLIKETDNINTNTN